jgi:hypothetical protein
MRHLLGPVQRGLVECGLLGSVAAGRCSVVYYVLTCDAVLHLAAGSAATVVWPLSIEFAVHGIHGDASMSGVILL